MLITTLWKEPYQLLVPGTASTRKQKLAELALARGIAWKPSN